MSQDTVAAQDRPTRFTQWQGREPESVAADTTYGNGGVFAMVGGSEHHSLYANPRQYPQKEQPVLRSRAVHLSARKQPLSVPQASPSTTAVEVIGSRLYLYRDPQTSWAVLAKTVMHQGGTSPATRTGVGEHARVRPCTAAKEEGRSSVRGTKKSDRAASLAPAEIEVCPRAVLPGSGGPKHQATRAVPQPTDNAFCNSSIPPSNGQDCAVWISGAMLPEPMLYLTSR
jgi:hypothetical protein